MRTRLPGARARCRCRWMGVAAAVWIAAGPTAALEPDVAPEATPPEPIPEESFHPEPEPAGESRYVVRAGDTLSGIAARELGSAHRWREIARLNGLERPDRLRVGQELSLPGSE